MEIKKIVAHWKQSSPQPHSIDDFNNSTGQFGYNYHMQNINLAPAKFSEISVEPIPDRDILYIFNTAIMITFLALQIAIDQTDGNLTASKQICLITAK